MYSFLTMAALLRCGYEAADGTPVPTSAELVFDIIASFLRRCFSASVPSRRRASRRREHRHAALLSVSENTGIRRASKVKNGWNRYRNGRKRSLVPEKRKDASARVFQNASHPNPLRPKHAHARTVPPLGHCLGNLQIDVRRARLEGNSA